MVRSTSSAALIGAMALAACSPPPPHRPDPPAGDPVRGRALIVAAGCAACHVVPGIDWPQGRVGPALAGLGRRGPIAGVAPADAGTLAAFVRHAPSFAPTSAMPPMPLTEREALDVAAYLLEAS